jgi:uncharacterized DUF497 family protein
VLPYRRLVGYEWDARKDDENRRKHGLRLSDGIAALRDPRRLESTIGSLTARSAW